jgi:hypothetical protein
MAISVGMKVTIEIPDSIMRKAKLRAASRAQPLKQFITDALQAGLAAQSESGRHDEPAWMGGFGRLRRLRKETARIQGVIDETFEVIDSEGRV